MRFLALFNIFVLSATSAPAALVISFQNNTTMTEQQAGTIDLFVTGGPGDTLGRFGYEFVIRGATGSSGDLQFQNPQLQTEPTLSNYVFHDTVFPSSPTTTNISVVSLIGEDTYANENSDFVNIEGTYLLARLEL